MDQVNLNEIEENRASSPERALEAIPPELSGHISVESWNMLTIEQRSMLKNIEKLPEALMGVVPESVWETLSVPQKLEFIYSHKLLTRQESVSPEITRESIEEEQFSDFRHTVEGDGVPQISVKPEQSGESSAEQLGSQFEDIRKEISEIEQVSENESATYEEVPDEQFIAPDDVETITRSSGATFSEDLVPKFAGYQPDDSFLMNIEEKAKGDPKDSGTWAANIIEKFRIAFGGGE